MRATKERASTASARPAPALRASAIEKRLPARTSAGSPRQTALAEAASPDEVSSHGWHAALPATAVAIAAKARCRRPGLLAQRTEDAISRGRDAPNLPRRVGDATAFSDVRRELHPGVAALVDGERVGGHRHRQADAVETERTGGVRPAEDVGGRLRGAARRWARLRGRGAAIAVDDADARVGCHHHRLAEADGDLVSRVERPAEAAVVVEDGRVRDRLGRARAAEDRRLDLLRVDKGACRVLQADLIAPEAA